MSLSTEALIEHSAKHLAGLGRSEQITDFARQNPELVEKLIDEFDFAIDMLNYWLNDDYEMLHFAPKAEELHAHLGRPTVWIPTITEMRSSRKWVAPFNRGLREERRLLAAGEADSEEKLPGSAKILFSNFDNSNEAYVLGAIGHTWERTCVAALRKHPPTNHVWQKDELLIPLEDVVVYLGVLGSEDVPNLYRLMSTPPNPDNGGVGWITKERIAQTDEMLSVE